MAKYTKKDIIQMVEDDDDYGCYELYEKIRKAFYGTGQYCGCFY